jgi:hypothetical protein
MKYVCLSPLNSKSAAIACAPKGTPAAYKLIDGLKGLKELPFDLTLKKTEI